MHVISSLLQNSERSRECKKIVGADRGCCLRPEEACMLSQVCCKTPKSNFKFVYCAMALCFMNRIKKKRHTAHTHTAVFLFIQIFFWDQEQEQRPLAKAKAKGVRLCYFALFSL